MVDKNIDYNKKYRHRNLPRIPFPTSNKNENIDKVAKKYKWKAEIGDIENGPKKKVGKKNEVINLSSKGVAVFLDEEDFNKYNHHNMAIYISLSNGENDENFDGLLARVCNDKSREATKGGGILRVAFLGDNANRKKIRKKLSYGGSYLKGYIETEHFKELVHKEVEYNKDESLYKYLDRVLWFTDNFVNSDLGMVGYVVQNKEGKEVISVEDTIFVGPSSHKFKQEIIIAKSKHAPLEELSEQDVNNFQTNQDKRYSCMAHSQISKDIYFINYPKNEGKKQYQDYWRKKNKRGLGPGCMNDSDRAAARAGKFSRTNKDILAEITVPIKIKTKEKLEKQDNDKVIALLNFELIKPDDEREHGFYEDVIRDILQIIREKVEPEIAKAVFQHYNSFKMLLYHTMMDYLMGEPFHALNELGRWREIQCRKLFREHKGLQDVFKGYREFLNQEVHLFNTNFPDLETRNHDLYECYNELLNISANPKGEDKHIPKNYGETGIGWFYERGNAKSADDLEMIQRLLIPTTQLHFILNKLVEVKKLLKTERYYGYLEKANNIIRRIEGDKKVTTNYHTDVDVVIKESVEDVKKYVEDLKKNSGRLKKNIAFNIAKLIKSILNNNFKDGDKINIKYVLRYLLHMEFIIGIAQLHHIIRSREQNPEMTFKLFEVMDERKREYIQRFIGTCSLLILSESVASEIIETSKGKPPLTVPMIMAYIYRAQAFLLMGQNHNAYNDFISLERLLETRPDDFIMDFPKKQSKPFSWLSQKRAEQFKEWLKVFLNYHKGRIYFASFSKSQALVSFCKSVEKLYDFDNKYTKIPRIINIESMMYKGKGFFERGSYSRSLKWYFKAVYEIVKYLERWWEEARFPKEVWSHFQYALIEELIALTEDFKHNAIIDKEKSARKLILKMYRENQEEIPESDFRDSDLLKKLKNLEIVIDAKNKPRHVLFNCKISALYNKLKPLFKNKEKLNKANSQLGDIYKYSSRFLRLFATFKEMTKDFPKEKINSCQDLIDHLKNKHLCTFPPKEEDNGKVRLLDCLFPDKIAKGYITQDELNKEDIALLEKNSRLLKRLIDADIVVEAEQKNIRFKITTEEKLRGMLRKTITGKHVFKEYEIGNVINFFKGMLLKNHNNTTPVLRDKVERDLAILHKVNGAKQPEEYRFNKIFSKETDLKEELNDIFPKDKEKIDEILKAWELTVCLKPMGIILSDVLNRIGFLLFDLRLHPEEIENEEVKKLLTIDGENEKYIDLALDWVEKASDINPDNGFAGFNQLLIKESPPRKGIGSGANEEDRKNIESNFIQAFNKMGQFHRQFYPIILHWIWEEKRKWKENEKQKKNKPDGYDYYKGLFNYQLRYIDDFIRKPSEIYEYLTKERTIPRSSDNDEYKNSMNGLYFLGRYSSWTPKLPRPRVFSINGGGKFLVWKGKGILIDPGFDLLNNLYAEGFSLEDIDAVIITHDHHDHTEDFEPMWRLIKEHNEVINASVQDSEDNDKAVKKRLINLTLFTNLGFGQKCSRFLSSDSEETYVERIYSLSKGTRLSPEGFAFDIEILEAKHKEDLTRKYPIGFMLRLKEKENSNIADYSKEPVFRVGFTSDTRFDEKLIEPYYDCDVVVANISNATFRELKVKLGFDDFNDEEYRTKDGKKKFFDEIRDNSATERRESATDMKSVLKWSFWYRERNWVDNWLANEPDCSDNSENCTKPAEREKDCKGCQYVKFPGVLEGHLGASGIYKIWDGMNKNVEDDKEKLLILGEFREEMGSFRNKVAKLLNDEFERVKKGIFSKNDFQDGLVTKLLKGEVKIIKELNSGHDHVQFEGTIQDEDDLIRRLSIINEIDSSEEDQVLTFWKLWREQYPQGNIHCFTSDIGMAVRFIKESNKWKSVVQCSVCRQDNDLYDFPQMGNKRKVVAYPKATFHSPNDITEVCIKGDAEGMVYLCEEHNTGPQGLFVEHLERFDLFNSEGVPL